MKRLITLLSLLTLVLATVTSEAVTPRQDLFLKATQFLPWEPSDDLPVASRFTMAPPETIWFGGHDGAGYALEGGLWDFDTEENGGPGFQGWYGVDQTENTGVPWGARVTSASFTCPDDAPMIDGTVGQLWFGKHLDTANAHCWACDAGGDCSDPATTRGYENNLCQRADSPGLSYGGGDVAIAFDYFLDLEGFPYDYVKVQLVAQPGGEVIGVRNVDDGDGGIIGSSDAPAAFDATVPSGDIPGGTTGITLRFEFLADGGWSDEDGGGGVCSTNGPFGADNIMVSDGGGVKLDADFDSGDEGFTFSHCPGNGNFVDIHDVGIYEILDACQCNLEGNILSFHDDNFEHPDDPDGSGGGQHNMAVSPIIDRRNHPAAMGFNDIFYWTDLYAWMPLNDGVLYRPGAMYSPWECKQNPGEPGWSAREGQAVWWYVGADPACFRQPNNFVEDGVPGNADYYRVVWELLSCCACFGIGDCSGQTNETPLLDNIRFGLTRAPDAPIITIWTGPLVDIYAEDGTLNPASTGRVDIGFGGHYVVPPYILADSMAVAGPVVGDGTPSWEAFLHFSLARKGPMQDAVPAYSAWKARLSGDPETEFVSVKMDSTELSSNPFSNKFCSFAHEEDPFFNNAFGDHTDENEILPDNVFTPGTQIEFYVTADFDVDGMDEEGTGTEFYRLPEDGQYEFEILPSMRWSGEEGNSPIVWPCLLYWDVYNKWTIPNDVVQPWIEKALATPGLLPDVPGPGPDHDRFDQVGATSCCGSDVLFRSGGGGTSGGTLFQLLSYNTILLNTGLYGLGTLEREDMIGLEDWLLATVCDSPNRRRGLIANGNEVAGIIQLKRPSMMTSVFGAGLECAPYREPGCPPGAPSDSSDCAELIGADGAAYPPAVPYYAFGNGCPNVYTYSVLFADGGVGNRDWYDYDGDKGVVSFAQVVHDESGGAGNFRAVLDGYSYHLTTSTFDGEECVADSVGRVTAIASEIAGALDWIFEGEFESFCVACEEVDAPEVEFGDLRVNRLYQNEPNPFNPRTAITFSVARKGPVELSIYDVAGRLVRRLVDAPREAGLQTVVWDGLDGRGHAAGSGVYWSQLRVEDYVSNKKMVLLK